MPMIVFTMQGTIGSDPGHAVYERASEV